MAHHNQRDYQDPRYASAQYLLGMAPMPPVRSQDFAVAQMNAALNNGQFAHPNAGQRVPTVDELLAAYPDYAAPRTQAPVSATQIPTSTTAAQGNQMLDVHIPYGAGAGEATTPMTKIITFDMSSILPTDFLDRVCAVMGGERRTTKLGWRTCDAKRKDPWNQLDDTNDVKKAFDAHRVLLSNTRRSRAVYMEVSNVAKPPPALKETQREQPESTPYGHKFAILKNKYACSKCTKGNEARWCLIVPGAPGEPARHRSFTLPELTYWAKIWHEFPDEYNENTPPRKTAFDDINSRARPPQGATRRRGGNPPPDIHVHLDRSILGDASNARPDIPVVGSKRKEHEDSSDSETEDVDKVPIPIADVLEALDTTLPDLHYPQYREALVNRGIVYARSVLDFDRNYFVQQIGMTDGSVGEFLRFVESMLKKQEKQRRKIRKGKKRVRLADEDVADKENGLEI